VQQAPHYNKWILHGLRKCMWICLFVLWLFFFLYSTLSSVPQC